MPTITPKRLAITGIGCYVVYLAFVAYQGWALGSGSELALPFSPAVQMVSSVLAGLTQTLGVTLVVGGLVLQGVRTLLAESNASANHGTEEVEEAEGLEGADVLDSNTR